MLDPEKMKLINLEVIFDMFNQELREMYYQLIKAIYVRQWGKNIYTYIHDQKDLEKEEE